MDLNTKVSIIVPCYNEESYATRCLDSIIANDYPKEHLGILIYDGGEDSERLIVTTWEGFESNLVNIKYVFGLAWSGVD